MKKIQAFAILIPFAIFSLGRFVSTAIGQNRKRVEIPTSIVKQIIYHPQLHCFFHLEVASRNPLLVSDNLINPYLSPREFSFPIRVLPESKLKSGAYLQFTDFNLNKNIARIRIRYKTEGVGGLFVFRSTKKSAWQLVKAEVWEN